MYGMLSEIAHSAKPETYTLLGYEKQEDDSVGINLFGVYDENIKVTFGIHTDIFCRFFIEMLQFQKSISKITLKTQIWIGCVMILFLLA